LTNFSYKARDRYGAPTAGTMEAADAKEVAHQLGKLNYTPISIAEAGSKGVLAELADLFTSLSSIKAEDLIVFTRQLASIIDAGVPLTEGLNAVSEQIRNKKFCNVVIAVRQDIENGATFSDALEKHQAVFSPLIINMVRAGEKAGILGEELDRISALMEKDQQTIDKIKTATRYPIIVVGSLVIAFTVLMIFVIPKFVTFFSAFKAELPLPTRILIGMNNIIQGYWYVLLGSLSILFFCLKKYLATEQGRYAWDQLILSLPIFGPLFTKIFLSRFARMLSAMLKSGIPILEALMITAASVSNKVIAKVTIEIRDKVAEGKSLVEPMRNSLIFPPIAISMVAIGEKAGSLESMLNKISDYFDREADYTINNLTPLMEPIMIFGLGLIVMLFALGIFLPMWDLVRVYQNF
jgi:type II secretory pathway component PulF